MTVMTDNDAHLRDSTLYQEFLAEREEIMRHKWIESQKAGRDIGFEQALADWMVKYRQGWLQHRRALRSAPAKKSEKHPLSSRPCSSA